MNSYHLSQTITDWPNPAAFCMPAAGTFGNCGRNTINRPNFRDVDFSLLKETKLGESRNLELCAEFFDIFNHRRSLCRTPRSALGASEKSSIPIAYTPRPQEIALFCRPNADGRRRSHGAERI